MGSVMGIISEETPKYALASTQWAQVNGVTYPYEVRRYEPTTAIETLVDSRGRTKSQDKGFMTLASYIGVRGTPKNDGAEKIAMTAPVVTTMSEADPSIVEGMQFILPYETTHHGHTAPKPTDPNHEVKVIERASKWMAVHSFSGHWEPEETLAKRDEFLKVLLANDELRPYVSGTESSGMPKLHWELYRYNPPWTIPAMRTNEIAVQLSDAYKPSKFERLVSKSEAKKPSEVGSLENDIITS